jgi:hypothetical protein
MIPPIRDCQFFLRNRQSYRGLTAFAPFCELTGADFKASRNPFAGRSEREQPGAVNHQAINDFVH